MDKLDKLFDMQNQLDSYIRCERNLEFSKSEWLQKQVLAMLSELTELLDEVNFKWWKNEKPIDTDNVKDEIVDVFHFFMSMCLTAEMPADELFSRYLKKNQENFNRQQGKSEKAGYSLGK